jgi:hypothetical protein
VSLQAWGSRMDLGKNGVGSDGAAWLALGRAPLRMDLEKEWCWKSDPLPSRHSCRVWRRNGVGS